MKELHQLLLTLISTGTLIVWFRHRELKHFMTQKDFEMVIQHYESLFDVLKKENQHLKERIIVLEQEVEKLKQHPFYYYRAYLDQEKGAYHEVKR